MILLSAGKMKLRRRIFKTYLKREMGRHSFAQLVRLILFIVCLQHSYTVSAGVTECIACINSSECVYCNAAFYNKKPDYCLCNQSEVCKTDFNTLDTMTGCRLEPIPPDVLKLILRLGLAAVSTGLLYFFATRTRCRPHERFEFEMTYIPEPETFAQNREAIAANEKQDEDGAQITDKDGAKDDRIVLSW